MSSSEDMSGLDKDSEFDSEEENLEFQLYQQLYFEPNSDITEIDTKINCSTMGQHDDNSVPETCDKQFAQLNACQLNQINDPKQMPEMKRLASLACKIHENQNSQIENCIYVDSVDGAELTLVDSTVQQTTQDTQNHPQQRELHGNTSHEVSVSGDFPHIKRNVMPLNSIRERLSSTCSDASIPGSVPLDELYCNLVTSDEEDDITLIKDRLMIKDLKTNNQDRNKEKAKAKSNKRKRRKTTGSDDETEDSRCNSLISAVSKNAVSKDGIDQLGDDSNSDGDIYILPPPIPRNPEILTIESSSDNEVEAGNRDVTCIRTKNNKYQKIEMPLSSPHIWKKDGKSKGMHQISGSGEKQGRKEGDNVAAETESDTNDVDLPEATKGTDLTLNIDKSLSGWVKTITKYPDTTKKTRKASKKPYNKSNRPTIDFTKDRPNTAREPSCKKWTQSMANFYDSDVSDDLDVSEIHLQQSDSPANWCLIAADYQITQRRRYYNAPERCKLCKQDGHTSNKCPRVPTCHLCSGTDHSSRSDCPQNCCFKCGGEPHFFCPITDLARVCNLCGFPGHRKDFCPDLWRRFHLTTNGMVAQAPSEHTTRPSGERYCYSCGRRGHYGHECPIRFQNRLYSQVPQSVVSYCRPVNLVDGRFVVNVDATQPALLEESVTTLPIKSEDVGRIIGKKGGVVKSIIKESGAHVRVIQEGQPQVLLFGPSEARLKAQEIIEVLLGKKNNGRVDFVEHLNNNRCSMPMTSGISESVAMVAGKSNSSQNSSWCEQFLTHLDRRKRSMLKEMRNLLESLRRSRKMVNLKNCIKQLKSFRTIRTSEPFTEPSQTVKQHLNRIAMKVVGSKDFGDGHKIHNKITSLLKQVKTCHSSIVPEEICVQVAETMELLQEPSIEKFDELLQYAEQYRHDYLKKKSILKRIAAKKLNNVAPNEKKINKKPPKAMKKKKAKKSKNQHANKVKTKNASGVKKINNKNKINAGKKKAKNHQ